MIKTNFFVILLITFLGYALFNSYQCLYEYAMIKLVGKKVYNSFWFHFVTALILTVVIYLIVKSIEKIKFSTFGFKEI